MCVSMDASVYSVGVPRAILVSSILGAIEASDGGFAPTPNVKLEPTAKQAQPDVAAGPQDATAPDQKAPRDM
jgi:hypothetical protein